AHVQPGRRERPRGAGQGGPVGNDPDLIVADQVDFQAVGLTLDVQGACRIGRKAQDGRTAPVFQPLQPRVGPSTTLHGLVSYPRANAKRRTAPSVAVEPPPKSMSPRPVPV